MRAALERRGRRGRREGGARAARGRREGGGSRGWREGGGVAKAGDPGRRAAVPVAEGACARGARETDARRRRGETSERAHTHTRRAAHHDSSMHTRGMFTDLRRSLRLVKVLKNTG